MKRPLSKFDPLVSEMNDAGQTMSGSVESFNLALEQFSVVLHCSIGYCTPEERPNSSMILEMHSELPCVRMNHKCSSLR